MEPVTINIRSSAFTDNSESKCCRRLRTVYYILATIAVWATTILGLKGHMTFGQLGFFCGDQSISRKFNGEYISSLGIVAISIVVPLPVLGIYEFLQYQPRKFSLNDPNFKLLLNNLHRWLIGYNTALIFTLFSCMIGKLVIVEPRPHFIDSCKPSEALTCTNGEFVTKFKCEVKDAYYVVDLMSSFPSGHAGLSFCMGWFLFCYLQVRGGVLERWLLTQVLQMLAVAWMLSCSMFRVYNHRHHWWDVLAGAVIGTVWGCHGVFVRCKNFSALPKVNKVDLEYEESITIN